MVNAVLILTCLPTRQILKTEVIMPALNGTGPQGAGPLTGRRMGNCVGNTNSGNTGYGRGLGRRFRGGGGFGHSFGGGFGFSNNQDAQNLSDKNAVEDEINVLKNQLSFLEKQLSKIPLN